MTQSRHIESRPARSRPENARASDLASRALDVLAAARRTGRAMPVEAWIRALTEAVTDTDPSVRGAVTERMRAAGIAPEEISDLYIPAVARRLGDAWCEDRLSFSDVTIGTARLQAMLRDDRIARVSDPVDEFRALMIMVLADEHHTLGAMVLTSQLRRSGASVNLTVGRPEAEIDLLVGERDFDAILLSVARADEFGDVARTVARLRSLTKGHVPLIVGGSIMELGTEPACRATGADHATCDAREALKLIGDWTRV